LQHSQPDHDAKAELNRRSQACEVLTGTGVRVVEIEPHFISVWESFPSSSTDWRKLRVLGRESESRGAPMNVSRCFV
jgi:hypothetical protein